MKEGTCVKCGDVTSIYAKGLCTTCYRKQLPPRKRSAAPPQKDFCVAKPPEQVELSFAPDQAPPPEKKRETKPAPKKEEKSGPRRELKDLCMAAAGAIVERIERECLHDGDVGDIKVLAEALGKIDDIIFAVEQDVRG
jgi:hypothetical protein